MRLRLVVDGESREIELERGPGGVRVRVDGAEYRARIRPGKGGFEVRIGSRLYRIRFEGLRAVLEDASHDIRVAEIADERRVEDRVARGGAGVTLEIRAAMPGRVVRVAVAAGDRVARGETLVVLEAMKMQNEIPAPGDGVVRSIGVAEGDSINADRVVAVLVVRGRLGP